MTRRYFIYMLHTIHHLIREGIVKTTKMGGRESSFYRCPKCHIAFIYLFRRLILHSIAIIKVSPKAIYVHYIYIVFIYSDIQVVGHSKVTWTVHRFPQFSSQSVQWFSPQPLLCTILEISITQVIKKILPLD